MRIACPACNAAYQVPEEQLSNGRVVRCARCGTDWAPDVAIPDSPADPAPAPAEPVPDATPAAPDIRPEPVMPPPKMALEDDDLVQPVVTPLPPPVPPPKRRRGSPWLAIAWLLSLAVVAGALTVAVTGRERVMQVWPPSVRAYAAIGLAPSLRSSH